jgi:Rel/ankyrin family protein
MREQVGVDMTDINLTDVIDVLATGDKSGDLSSYPLYPGQPDLLKPQMDPHKAKKNAYVRMLEQPASKGLRFRYECEGRSAGSIPGSASTQDNRTFPTIQVVGYTGRAVVVVSCVTFDPPYRPHPHNLVGKEGCKKGVCTIPLGENMTVSFPNLGIQCVKKKDIDESLTLRQQIRVDPFQTGFSHKSNPQNIDLNCVRLAFQVFLEGNEKGAFTFALKPVVSDPIFDKKAKCDLTICRLTETSGPVAGGKEILLFCDKITKDDIQVRFFEEQNGHLVWEGFGDFQPSDVHKQYGICFRTPRYKNIEIEQPLQVQLQLKRPSDGAVSESRSFEFIPLDAGRAYWSAKRLKTNYTVFNQILSRDQATRQGELQPPDLKHKIPLSRAPVLAGAFTAERSAENAYEGASMDAASQQLGQQQLRQQLKPVAMPGGMTHSAPQSFLSNLPSNLTTSTPSSSSMPQSTPVDTESISEQINSSHAASVLPPQVPVRSPHKSNLLTGAYDTMAGQPQQQRPLSDMSMMSDFSSFTQCDNASITTRQSVNEILSLADMSVYSGDTLNLDNISVSTFLQDPNNLQQQFEIKEEPQDYNTATLRRVVKNPALDIMGSMTSVATVKENKPAELLSSNSGSLNTIQAVEEASEPVPMDTLDMDIGQIYDDVMQGVYDDVDVKYDDVNLITDQAEPPVPPMRKRGLSVDHGIEKPLPVVPKTNIITKLAEKKNELLTAREKELEKKRLAEEQKKKEREEIEEQKRKEREEKEKKKIEEKEAKRMEEEQKKAQKKKEEEERKTKKLAEMEDEHKLKTSLFQRLFQRSQSRTGDVDSDPPVTGQEDLESPPPVPPHHAPQNITTQLSIESQLTDLEQLIQSGDLQRLDSVVSEFANQFPPDSGENLNNPELSQTQSVPQVQS